MMVKAALSCKPLSHCAGLPVLQFSVRWRALQVPVQSTKAEKFCELEANQGDLTLSPAGGTDFLFRLSHKKK